MSNFNVLYNIILADKFSKNAIRIKNNTTKMSRKFRIMNVVIAKSRRKFQRLNETIGKAGRGIRNFGLKMSLLTTLPIVLIGRAMITAASDAEETISKFNVVFSGIKKQADSVADNLVKNFGMAGSQARLLLGDTGDLLTGFGFTQKMALSLSDEVNQLAVDLASFTNFSGGSEGASRALTKALLGERESVKTLGISILEEDVKKKVQILLSQGMRFATLRQAKAFATLRIAQDQSKNAIGDYNRTQDQFANKSRLLSVRILDLKEKFGKVMIPIALKLTNVLIKLTEKFAALSPTTKKIILIFAAVAAVLGPLLVIFGAVLTMLPLMVAGFGLLAVAVNLAALPVLAVVAAFAAGYLAGKLLISLFQKLKKFSFGAVFDKVKGLFGKTEAVISANNISKSTVDVNLNAPSGIIKSVKSKTRGSSKLNVGTNMVPAGA